MNYRESMRAELLQTGVVPVVRLPDTEHMTAVAEAVAAGGACLFEITTTTHGWLSWLEEARARFEGRLALGVGTVRTPKQLEDAVNAGAQFIVSPGCRPTLIAAGLAAGVLVLPGVLTPTEVELAKDTGADIVKLFPIQSGGPAYVEALLAAIDDVGVIPVGGIDASNAAAYVSAGAVAVGIGAAVVNDARVAASQFAEISTDVGAVVSAVAAARTTLANSGADYR